MDLDEEILQRLGNTEDHFTERKEAPHQNQIRKVIVAFANSSLPEKSGIIYVGVSNKGVVKGGGGDMKKWQNDITSWANSCFPPIEVATRALSQSGKEFLAVVVSAMCGGYSRRDVGGGCSLVVRGTIPQIFVVIRS